DNTADLAAVTGQFNPHLVDINDAMLVHCCVRADWRALQLAAREAGFDLQAVSAFRSFSRQLDIWNAKARGERDVLDACAAPVNLAGLDPSQRLWAILRWSALPGASRHHWGTDLDVIDRAAVGCDFRVQLIDDEVYGDGPFVALHDWLDSLIEQNRAYGFYRPYHQVQGRGEMPTGVAPERWHLSHRPTSVRFEACLQCDTFREALREFYRGLAGLELRDAVLQNFNEIYSHFIRL
ncbi:MAG: M15 family metallopeptidase, partial [Gammaproteobacteria bacterium]|nr:M15 family metallopeptidase [Gammaproteobacteria bacterium]